jgi:hypothetical protein
MTTTSALTTIIEDSRAQPELYRPFVEFLRASPGRTYQPMSTSRCALALFAQHHFNDPNACGGARRIGLTDSRKLIDVLPPSLEESPIFGHRTLGELAEAVVAVCGEPQ